MTQKRGLFEECCGYAGRRFPDLGRWGGGVLGDKELEKSLDLLDLDVREQDVHSLSLLCCLSVFLLTFAVTAVSLFSGSSFLALTPLMLVFPFLVCLYVEKYPIMLLESRRTEMMGHIPAIASYFVISLRINPVMEKAVEFASEHTAGFPRKMLKRMVFEIQMGRSSSMVESLSRFSEEWGGISEFKAFTQMLVASTLEASEKGRWLMLENGMTVLLAGLRERTEAAARNLETPILVIFTFLVILPLVFIGLVPMIPTIGVNISPLMIFFIYDVVLPVILYIAITFVVSSKPITIPPVAIPQKEHLKVFSFEASRSRRYMFFSLLFLASLAVSLPGILDLLAAMQGRHPSSPLGTSFLIIGLAFGAGMYFLASSYNVKKMRDIIRDEEDEFIETLRQLSVLLSSGRPLPNAMAHLSEINRGRTAAIFSKAAGNIKLFNIDMREAFFSDKCGSASKVYSDVIRGSIETTVAMSGRSSKSIASVIIRLAEHIRNMRSVDLEMKKIISSVTSSMVLIAVFVGPLIGGVATSLGYLIARTLSGSDVSAFGFGVLVSVIDPELIKFIIGVYVLQTTAILSVFSDELVYGSDGVIKRYHLGLYLPVSAFVFVATVFMVENVLVSIA